MRILFLSQYFPPEVGATQGRAHDMASSLVQAGHEVTVICEFPNHPSGRMPARYEGKWYERDVLDGIRLVRVWVKASPFKSFSSRIALYTSYMGMATGAGLGLVEGPFDLVYATSPPLFAGAAGMALSYLRRIPFVLEVRDPWPAAAEALGMIRHPAAIGLGRGLERLCYRRARRVVTVTRSWHRHLQERGVPANKLVLIPNGANTDLFHPRPEEAAKLRRALGLESAFVVLYAGLHGLVADLLTTLEAASRLQAERDVVFLLVGEGPEKERLVLRAKELGLGNVRFLPEVSRAEVPSYFSMANLTLVPIRKIPFFEGTLPAKIFDAWACGCPTLVAAKGEVRALLDEANAGVGVEPENPARMADTILQLRADPEGCRRLGENGRGFATAHFNRNAQARELVGMLESLNGLGKPQTVSNELPSFEPRGVPRRE